MKKIPYIEQDGKHDILQTSETILDESFIPAVRQMLTETSLDTIIFPSSSSVDAFMEYGGYYGIEPAALIKKLTVVCMGKSSGQQINEYGYTPDSVLSEPNAFELVKALLQEKVLESIK